MFYYVTRGENNYDGIKPSQVFIGKNVFDGVDKAFRIVVMPEYYNDYITDPNWSQYKDYIIAADYLPTDAEPVKVEGVTYDYVSRSLNTMSTSEITRLQNSAWNWLIPGAILASVASGGTFGAVVACTSWLDTFMEAAMVSKLIFMNMTLQTASVAAIAVAGATDALTSTAKNYLLNRAQRFYSRPATWKMYATWIRTEQTDQ